MKFILYGLIVLTLVLINTDSYQAKVNEVTHEQTKAQVSLFREALDKFGANSPEQVISIWANGEKTRNGVFHYVVACNELKARFIQEWGQPEDSYWIHGTSSPWLDRYEVAYNNKLSDFEHEVKLIFYWTTSAGPTEPSETILSIIKNGDIWCVKEVK